MRKPKVQAQARHKRLVERNSVPPLRLVFPRVTQMRIELTFNYVGKWLPSNQVHILHPAAAATFKYPCPAAGCDGFFELDTIVAQSLANANGVTQGELSCIGVRPEDREARKPCGLHLRYRVDATF